MPRNHPTKNVESVFDRRVEPAKPRYRGNEATKARLESIDNMSASPVVNDSHLPCTGVRTGIGERGQNEGDSVCIGWPNAIGQGICREIR